MRNILRLPATTSALALAFVLAVAACGGDSTPTTTGPTGEGSSTTSTTTPAEIPLSTTSTAPLLGPSPSDYAAFREQATACGAAIPEAASELAFTAPEDQALDPASKVRATIVTSCGDVVLELDPSQAPETVNSFVFLARNDYFDGTASHRILPGFVLQAGDPTATGRGGPGYTVPDELPPDGFRYGTGVVAMANAGPDTTGSQFFIMLGPAGLPPAYSYFGTVVDGFDTLEKIASLPLGPNARGEVSVPLQTLYIEDVVIEVL